MKGDFMQNLSKIELENLKELINYHEMNYQKLINYSDYAVDPQIKQTFNKAAQDSLNIKQKLTSFLN
jgi:hypothetical protein